MSLVNLMGVSLARINKTFKPAGGEFAGGVAVTSDPHLIELVYELCSIRNRSVGAIAEIWRKFQKDDRKAAREHMAASEEAKINKGLKLAASRANKLNNAMEVELATTKARLVAELKACGKFKTTKVDFLKKQIMGRINRKRKYTTIPEKFKARNKKQIKLTAPKEKRCRTLKSWRCL